MAVKTKEETVRARVDASIKNEAVSILEQLGLSTTDAIRMLLHQIVLCKGLPFAVKMPNEETQRVLREINQHKNLVQYDSLEAMFRDLDN